MMNELVAMKLDQYPFLFQLRSLIFVLITTSPLSFCPSFSQFVAVNDNGGPICVEMILAKDGSLGAVRDSASKSMAMSAVIMNYVSALEASDLSDCPDAFKTAFDAHLQAWRSMVPITDRYPALRGELHELFDSLAKGPDAEEFERRSRVIMETWRKVEDIVTSTLTQANDEKTDRIAQLIDSLANSAEYSGSVHLIRDGIVIHSNGYGRSCDGVANAAHTVYEIGSTSKQFTAFLIVDLMVNGKIAPEDTLGKFFEEVPDDKRSITIHQLLTHTSGLEMYHDRKGALEKMTREKALDRIFKQKLEFPPGSQYGYSNSAYTLLAILIERVTERSFMENIKSLASEHAITIGLYGEQLWPRDSVACGRGLKREGHPYDRGEAQWAGQGAGYLMMDLPSYGRWVQTLIRSPQLEQHRKLLFTGYSAYPDVENAKYGYGWVIQEQEAGKVIYHNGGDTDLGYVTTVRYYPDMEVILIMSTNVYEDGQKMFKLKNSIRDLVRSATN